MWINPQLCAHQYVLLNQINQSDLYFLNIRQRAEKFFLKFKYSLILNKINTTSSYIKGALEKNKTKMY